MTDDRWKIGETGKTSFQRYLDSKTKLSYTAWIDAGMPGPPEATIFGMSIKVDPTLPPDTVEIRGENGDTARIMFEPATEKEASAAIKAALEEPILFINGDTGGEVVEADVFRPAPDGVPLDCEGLPGGGAMVTTDK